MKRYLIVPLVMMLGGFTTGICTATAVQSEVPSEQSRTQKKSQSNKKGPEWINGTWHIRMTIHNDLLGTIPVNTYIYINRTAGRIKVVDSGEVLYNGTYVVEDNSIKYDCHPGYCNILDLNMKTKKIDFGDGNYMVKISDSSGI